MSRIEFPGATTAPSPKTIQTARVTGRVNVSPAVADVIALHAFGTRRRDDDVLLVAVTSARVAAYAEAR